MKQALLLILCLLGQYSLGVFASSIPQSDDTLQRLFKLSGINLNYSSHIAEDSIIRYCTIIEARARKEKDNNTYFKAKQIEVNAHCLKGDIGVAIDEARKMYEDAKAQQHKLGTVLALQAIGDTYMHSNQYKQANEAFTEANEQMSSTGDNITRIRLLLQHTHTCMSMKQLESMHHYLTEAERLLPQVHTASKNDYAFHLLCYQTFYHILKKDAPKAELSLNKVMQTQDPEGLFSRWRYDLCAHYYSLIKDYPKALAYSDSTLGVVKREGSVNEYKNSMIDKATLLVAMEMDEEACRIYEEAGALTDSLNIARYSDQIDTLRVTYWVDQLQLENAAELNKLLTWTIIFSTAVLSMLAIFIQVIKRRNRELKKSHSELAEASKKAASSIQSKSMFLSNMSHEIRTPLNAIVGFSEILTISDAIDSETKQQCGDNIKQNSDLLMKLVNDVMDISSLEENTMSFTFDDCDVIALCHNVVETINNVKRTSAQVKFITSLKELQLRTDSSRLQQVLINLLINATKFTNEGYITLTLRESLQNEEILFSVEDTGCGIPLEKQPNIFKRFEKLHEGIQGSGLGLSICHLIVENIGGKIWIDPEYTQGARFIFSHPLTPNEPQKPVI